MNLLMRSLVIFGLILMLDPSCSADEQLGTEGFAESGEHKIHYVTAGEGPLVVMIHGFPDYWYTWRNQIPEL
ncbi:MAG: alpha/beta hydrolase, partial [Pseudomonadota bacterium]